MKCLVSGSQGLIRNCFTSLLNAHRDFETRECPNPDDKCETLRVDFYNFFNARLHNCSLEDPHAVRRAFGNITNTSEVLENVGLCFKHCSDSYNHSSTDDFMNGLPECVSPDSMPVVSSDSDTHSLLSYGIAFSLTGLLFGGLAYKCYMGTKAPLQTDETARALELEEIV